MQTPPKGAGLFLLHSMINRLFIMADVDVVSDIIKKTMEAHPASNFVQSLAHQYLVRGWLSKKQLEGLYNKAQRVASIPAGKLATLEAQILKMPTRYKSSKPEAVPLYVKDERVAGLLNSILAKYPQHKRVLFLETKFNTNQSLSAIEITELEKFGKLLLK
jgi:hypothetical protein